MIGVSVNRHSMNKVISDVGDILSGDNFKILSTKSLSCRRLCLYKLNITLTAQFVSSI